MLVKSLTSISSTSGDSPCSLISRANNSRWSASMDGGGAGDGPVVEAGVGVAGARKGPLGRKRHRLLKVVDYINN